MMYTLHSPPLTRSKVIQFTAAEQLPVDVIYWKNYFHIQDLIEEICFVQINVSDDLLMINVSDGPPLRAFKWI